MASSTASNSRDLVPQEALDRLKSLETQFASTKKNAEALLVPIEKVSQELSKSSKSYKELIDAINKYEQVQKKVNSVNNEQRRILTERERLQQRIIQASSREAQEVQRLRVIYQQVQREQRNLARENVATNGSLEEMRARVARLTDSYRRLGETTRNSDIGKQLRSQIEQLNSEIDKLDVRTRRISKDGGIFSKIFSGTFLANIATKGISLFTAALADGVSKIISFEKANSVLGAILGENKESIKDLSDSAIELGRTSRYTASQVTQLQTELAKLGFTKNEIKDAQKDVLNFATALNANLDEAASLAGASLRAFGADSKESQRYLSAMAVSANKSALSFQYLATSIPIVAPVAKAFNFTIEDTLALLGTLSNSGFDASSAATALRNILLNLADSNGKLAKSLGRPIKNVDDLTEGLKELQAKGIDLATALELTDKRSVAAFQTFLRGADDIVPLRNQLIGVGDDLEDLAKKQMDNVAGAIGTLKSAWEGLMLSFSNSTGPMKTVIGGLTWIVNQLNEAVNAIEGIEGLSKYKGLIKENYDFSYERAKKRVKEKQDEGYSDELIFTIEIAQAKRTVEETKQEIDKLNRDIENNIRMGIQKSMTKSQEKTLQSLKFDLDSYEADLRAIESLQKEILKPEESPTGPGITIPDDKADKKSSTRS